MKLEDVRLVQNVVLEVQGENLEVRKGAQEVRNVAQEARKEDLEAQNGAQEAQGNHLQQENLSPVSDDHKIEAIDLKIHQIDTKSQRSIANEDHKALPQAPVLRNQKVNRVESIKRNLPRTSETEADQIHLLLMTTKGKRSGLHRKFIVKISIKILKILKIEMTVNFM